MIYIYISYIYMIYIYMIYIYDIYMTRYVDLRIYSMLQNSSMIFKAGRSIQFPQFRQFNSLGPAWSLGSRSYEQQIFRTRPRSESSAPWWVSPIASCMRLGNGKSLKKCEGQRPVWETETLFVRDFIYGMEHLTIYKNLIYKISIVSILTLWPARWPELFLWHFGELLEVKHFREPFRLTFAGKVSEK